MPSMHVPRYRYPSQFEDTVDDLMAELRSMILEGRYILTSEVRQFESAFADYCGTAFARGVNCGTDAIMVALLAIGIEHGDEVITQANTFHATAAAIRLIGAKPVLVDADEHSFLIDSGQVEAVVTRRTRVVMPVHLYGKPTRMTRLLEVAQRRDLILVEDAAQAHGARIDGKRVGSFGVAACFSFHPSKNLAAAGDAGAIVTNDPTLADKIDEYRALGQRAQNHHVRVGFNTKLHSIQAKILSAKLPHLDGWNASRRTVAQSYRQRLVGLPVTFQQESAGEEHVYHLFQIRTPKRDALLKHLLADSIDATVRYPTPLHLQPAFADCGWHAGQFPVAERLAKELLCLPIRPDMTPDEVDYVADSVRRFFGN
jgi:dTDP-4-amino-4,6-dideoxygalactose transaminase